LCSASFFRRRSATGAESTEQATSCCPWTSRWRWWRSISADVLAYKDGVRVRYVGDLQAELVQDFFGGFVNHAGANLHVKVVDGRSSHHKIEAIFKCFARGLKYACSKDRRLRRQLPSTKGLL